MSDVTHTLSHEAMVAWTAEDSQELKPRSEVTA
jgi:hypothetical protein